MSSAALSFNQNAATIAQRKNPKDSFLESLGASGYSAHTVKAYRQDLEHLEIWLSLQAHQVKPEALQRYLTKVKASLATKQRKHGAFQSFFRWCVRHDVLTANPMDKIDKIKVPKRKPRPIKPEDLKLLLDAIPKGCNRERLLILLLLETGMRISEVLSMRLENMDLSKRGREKAQVIGKGDKQRTVFLFDAPGALKTLRAYLKKEGITTGFVFPGAVPDSRLSYDAAHYHWEKFCKAAGFKEGGPVIHDLRHTYATLKLESGMEIAHISRLLGHESPVTTMGYSAATDRMIEAELRRVKSL